MIAMRRLLSLLLASFALVSCDAESPSKASAPVGAEDQVSISPRIVRSSAISDSLFWATTRVRATILNSAGDELAFQEADYGTGGLMLPAIDRDLEVKIRLDGYDGSRILLWSGSTALKRARDHASSGVRASNSGSVTDVQIFSRLVPGGGGDPGLDQDSLASEFLVGNWATLLYLNATDGTPIQVVASLRLNPDGTYALNQGYQRRGDSLVYAGLFELGAWTVADGLLGLVPSREFTCFDGVLGSMCDVPVAGSVAALPELYVESIAPSSPRIYFLEIASGYIKVTDILDATNFQTWIPFTPDSNP